MPILQSQQHNLTSTGPIIQVKISLPMQLRNKIKEKDKIHRPIRTNALIDTGASKTCISSRIVQELNLNPVVVY